MSEKPLPCPSCGSKLSRVEDSGDPIERQRAWKGWTGTGLWRLRRCVRCRELFTTEETVTGKYPQRPAESA